MKIVVITPYDAPNFGAYLQAYCLKYQLEKMGHEVIHVPTSSKQDIQNKYYTERPISKKDMIMPWKFAKKVEFGKEKLKLFQEDHKEFCISNDLKNIKADLFILGSDEIWNVKQQMFRKLIFWGKGLSPVISYAASIGRSDLGDFNDYPEHIELLENLKTILVRDVRTKQFVEQCANRKAELVCDPTMLVPVAEYGKEYKDSYIENNECILIYAYRLSSKVKREIRSYARKTGMKTVACCFQHDWCDHNCNCTPLQFSSLIRQCKAVITTTFHGTIFSILNHREFVTIPTSPKSNQLLEQLGLSQRLLDESLISADSLGKIFVENHINFTEIDNMIKKLREKSIQLLAETLNFEKKQGELFNYQICSPDECTGCFACMNKCPKQAISCIIDIQGRTLPQIDPAECIKCMQCMQVCPQINLIELHEPQVCYAAQRVDETARNESASGGIGAILAERIIALGGCVYGAKILENGQVIHSRADTYEEALSFRKSKYVQSYIGNTYKDVLEQIKTGRNILFTGTPCQIAGLKNYLGKEYDNLYCVDIICHGTPPMQYLKKHLQSVAKNLQIEEYSFRGGKKDFVLNVKANGKLLYSKDRIHDVYYYGFMNCLIFRENCYSCKYATEDRVGDLTIGDFRKLDRATLATRQVGNISVVLANSKKGQWLFDLIRDGIVSEQRNYKEALQGNPQLCRPALKHSKRETFITTYQKTNEFEKAIAQTGIFREMKILQIKRSILGRGLIKVKKIFRGKNEINSK